MIENKMAIFSKRMIIIITLSVFSIFCIIPILAILGISFSGERSLITEGYHIFPKDFDTLAYSTLLASPKQLISAYEISIIVTLLGGFLGLTVTALIAYPLSRSDFPWRKQIMFFVFFTMLFNGGLVPWYIIISKYLHLKSTLRVLILPYLANAWYIILMRTYMAKIPMSLIESAKIDGGSEFRIFLQIILPLSKPALATIGLFFVLQYWNDWWLSMLFIETEKFIPIQYMLVRIMSNIQYLTSQMSSMSVNIDISKLPNESARMALCLIAAGPMLFVFPFFQKYFVRGLTVGSIKG